MKMKRKRKEFTVEKRLKYQDPIFKSDKKNTQLKKQVDKYELFKI